MPKLWARRIGLATQFQLNRHQLKGRGLCFITRTYHDETTYLSRVWLPGGKGTNPDPKRDDGHTLLQKLGFLQQTHSGVFHLLPLGLRVQNKLERLIDKHMSSIGANKLSLSSISNESLWRDSGRLLGNSSSELLRLKSRAGDGFILSPTHEEEITSLVAGSVQSSKELPLRLYQIGRKYRDERRPRQGLLRAREFLMKDLYTFDVDEESALRTYHSVRNAYRAFFQEFKLPFLEAEADSGAMGGNYSHEFQYCTSMGEDHVVSCANCSYVANEELVEVGNPVEESRDQQGSLSFALDDNAKTLVLVAHPRLYSEQAETSAGRRSSFNAHALRKLFPLLDTSQEDPVSHFSNQPPEVDSPGDESVSRSLSRIDLKIRTLHCGNPLHRRAADARAAELKTELQRKLDIPVEHCEYRELPDTNVSPITNGSTCPRCQGPSLKIQPTVELGHTFHLGTRYTQPLGALITSPFDNSKKVPISMGCHGIGLSRMIGAIACILKDNVGLNWPVAMSPFDVVVIPGEAVSKDDVEDMCEQIYTFIECDVARLPDLCVDDRDETLPTKLRDADLRGYPVIVVMGRRWKEGMAEVQCRRLGSKEHVLENEVAGTVRDCLAKL
ncbi:MAG: hypothetical protein M1828_002829 [Chrysothrix sp. TS-e1954]|nr:MAG: hypothetical protein M1828_002829 [Chrysothrix sp. TS-e1954]